jgi:hypothetical protein
MNKGTKLRQFWVAKLSRRKNKEKASGKPHELTDESFQFRF